MRLLEPARDAAPLERDNRVMPLIWAALGAFAVASYFLLTVLLSAGVR